MQVESEEEDNMEDILATAEDTGIQTTDDGELPNLLEVFDLRGTNQYSFGFAAAQDTASVNRLLEMEEVQNLIPRNMELLRSEERRVGKECRCRWSPAR